MGMFGFLNKSNTGKPVLLEDSSSTVDFSQLSKTGAISDLVIDKLIENEKSELFYEIDEEINDDDITNIEYNGGPLWITSLSKGVYASDKVISPEFIENLGIRLANIGWKRFSVSSPVMEVKTKDLRISVWHGSRLDGNSHSLVIRKVPEYVRFDHTDLVQTRYAPENIINLMENCVTAHLSGMIGGVPQAGKSEFLKYLTQFIPIEEKVCVYEDTQDINYKKINPRSNSASFLVDDKVGFAEAIKAGLKHNAMWQILAEARGSEVNEFLSAMSNGTVCWSTLHLGDLRQLPDRLYTMAGEGILMSEQQFSAIVYSSIKVAALITCDIKQHRQIRQVAFYERVEGENKCHIIYEDGEFTKDEIPPSIMKQFRHYGINNPFVRVIRKEG